MKTNVPILWYALPIMGSLLTASGQQIIPPPPSAVYVMGLVPDWNQPNWHGANQSAAHPQNGGPIGDPDFRAWCVPTSVANVLGHWDEIHFVPHGLPTIGDGVTAPRSSQNWTQGAEYQDCQANGNGNRKSLPVGAPNDTGWYMNTNNIGILSVPPHNTPPRAPYSGTFLKDVSEGPTGGLNNFLADRDGGVARFSSLTHGLGYASPGSVLLPTAQHGFLELKAQVDAHLTAVAYFRHWNLTALQGGSPIDPIDPIDPGFPGLPGIPINPNGNPGQLLPPAPLPGHAPASNEESEKDHGFKHYTFGAFGPGQGDLSEEEYNDRTEGDHLGHAVTVIGYIDANSSSDVLGNTNWIIVHDNSDNTPRNVAVPMGSQWVANTIISLNPTFLSGLVPDWNQPNWHGAHQPANPTNPPANFPPNGGPSPADATFDAWCVPTSLANVLGHWDHAHYLPQGEPRIGDGMDYPISIGPWATTPDWQDFQANGVREANGQLMRLTMPPGVPNDLGWYMNTNGKGALGGSSHSGTYLKDVHNVSGFFEVMGDRLATYTHGLHFADAQIPKLRDVLDGFDELRRSIDNNRAAIVHFRHWNLHAPLHSTSVNGFNIPHESDFGLDYHEFGGNRPADLASEEWTGNNDEEGLLLGHAATVVGYITAGSSGDVLGKTNWLIVHDNSAHTARNVAVPMGNEWIANTIIAPTIDSDSDGQSDFAESLAGTDPFDSTSTLGITGISHSSSSNTVTWSSVPGKSYGVEYFDSSSASWISIGTHLATGMTSSFQDANAVRVSDHSGIYRIVLI